MIDKQLQLINHPFHRRKHLPGRAPSEDAQITRIKHDVRTKPLGVARSLPADDETTHALASQIPFSYNPSLVRLCRDSHLFVRRIQQYIWLHTIALPDSFQIRIAAFLSARPY